MTQFFARNLRTMRRALEHHNATCPVPAKAFLLNPIDHGLMRVSNLWGVPVEPDPSIAVERFTLACERRKPREDPSEIGGEIVG